MNDTVGSGKEMGGRESGKTLSAFIAVSVIVHLVIASFLLSATLNRANSSDQQVAMRVQLEATPIKQVEQEVVPVPEEPEALPEPKVEEAKKAELPPKESKKADKPSSSKSESNSQPKEAPKSAQVSTPTLPDVPGFEYPYYLNMLRAKLSAAWLYPSPVDLKKKVLRAEAAFSINRNGCVCGVRLGKSSKNQVFDRSVLRAVEAAAPFPPLPDGYEKEILGTLFVTFEYRS
ncbi:MAG: TonB C-terminal domain-containing protein [Candidatus Coatesbacteria bacterium]|nr:TonB C-terminal domain-containing protein [Candidatus Coatesbacteria bacterium]